MIDVTEEISAVAPPGRRGRSRRARRGVIIVSRSYATTLDDLWDACTNAERIPRWFLPVSGDLRLGGRYQFEGNAGGTIERCDPPRSVDATWEFGGDVSWVELRLVPESEERTRLELEHVAHVDEERWAQFGPGAVGVGWDGGVLGLGAAPRRPARASRPRRPPPGWHPRRASRSCAAAARAGARPASPRARRSDEARAAADRTTAAYTGVTSS